MRKVLVLSISVLLILLFTIISVGYAESAIFILRDNTTPQPTSTNHQNEDGIIGFLNNNSGFVNTLQTLAYIVFTIIIICVSLRQAKQLRDHHQENMNLQKFDKRALIFSQLCHGAYDDIDTTTAGLLFSNKTIIGVLDLRAHTSITNYLLAEIKNMTENLREINAEAYDSYSICLNRPEIFLSEESEIEEFISLLDDISETLNLKSNETEKLKYHVRELVRQNKYITKVHNATATEMKKEIESPTT